MHTEGRRGLHGALSRVKVHRERGRGSNPGSLPGGSEFLARFRGILQGAVGYEGPAPPLPLVRKALKEARPARAAGGIASSTPALTSFGASAEVLDTQRGSSVPGPHAADLRRPSGGLSGHALQPRGVGRPMVAQRGAACLLPQRLRSPRAPAAWGRPARGIPTRYVLHSSHFTEEKTAVRDGSVGPSKIAQLVLAEPRLRE